MIRIALGAIALQLLAIIGLLLAGGLLLLWVCWKMFRELRRTRGHAQRRRSAAQDARPGDEPDHPGRCVDEPGQRAGRGRGGAAAAPGCWPLGLLLSVVLMGVAANLLARMLERQRWIAWVGLLIVLYVAVHDDLARRIRGRRSHLPLIARC